MLLICVDDDSVENFQYVETHCIAILVFSNLFSTVVVVEGHSNCGARRWKYATK